MEFSYENQGASTYLVYEIKPNDSVDTLSLGMLTNNNIPGIAKTLFMQMDESKFIKFNVSSKISMQQYFSGIVNRKRLLGVFASIVEGLSAAEDYMLDPDSMVLDPNYIFVDVSNCSAVLICVPISNIGESKNDLCAFFKNIMVNTKFDQTENADHVAKIFNYLNSCVELSLADFKQLIDDLKNEQISISVQPIAPSVTAQQTYQQSAPPQMTNGQPALQYASQPMQKPVMQNNIPAKSGNYQPTFQQMPSAPQRPVTPAPQQTPPSPNMAIPQQTPPAPNTAMPRQPQRPDMAIPRQMPPSPNTAVPQQAQTVNGQKKMTMFDLLRHYSKENKEIYRSQKAARKAQNAAINQDRTGPGAKAPSGFAVPGANMNIPGGAANPNGGNPGFAVPGAGGAQNPSFERNNAKPPFTASAGAAGNFRPAPQNKTAPGPVNTPVPQANISSVGNQAQMNGTANGYASFPQNAAQKPLTMPAQAVQPTPASQPAVMQGQQLNFGETTVLSGKKPGETTVLNGGAQPRQTIAPHLIRTKNGEKIYINKPFFRVGKEKSYVDYFIGDNTAVSRSHANIITNNDKFFVVDTNSTNHTFVNGSMIQSNTETPINHGDKIRFANEEFEFRVY